MAWHLFGKEGMESSILSTSSSSRIFLFGS